MKKYILVLLLIVVAFVIYTNLDKKPADTLTTDTATEPTTLGQSDETYLMVLFNDGTGMRDVLAKGYTMRLVDNTITGKICNSFNGAYTLSTDAILTAPQVVSTKMYCEDDMAVEDAFFATLGKGLDMRTDGQDITLTAGNQVFVFKPGEAVVGL